MGRDIYIIGVRDLSDGVKKVRVDGGAAGYCRVRVTREAGAVSAKGISRGRKWC